MNFNKLQSWSPAADPLSLIAMRRALRLLLPAFLIGSQLGAMSLPLLHSCDEARNCAPGSACNTTCPDCPCSVQGVSGDVVSSDTSSPMTPLLRTESYTLSFSLPLNPTSIFHVPKPTLV